MSPKVLADPAEAPLPPPSQPLRRISFRSGQASEGIRAIAEEVAVALSYGGSTHAVMMATPQDLEDFAVGFSLTERIVQKAAEIETIAIVPTADGIDVQMWLAGPRADALVSRRRHLAGRPGAGSAASIVWRRRPAVRLRSARGSASKAVRSPRRSARSRRIRR